MKLIPLISVAIIVFLFIKYTLIATIIALFSIAILAYLCYKAPVVDEQSPEFDENFDDNKWKD